MLQRFAGDTCRPKSNAGQVRIRRTNWLITVGVCTLTLLTIGCALESLRLRELQERAYDRRQEALHWADQLGLGSDRLTNAVRAFAATGQEEYLRAFRHEEKEVGTRDLAVQRLIDLGLTPHEQQLLERSKSESDALINLENKAFAATDLQTRIGYVYGDEYREAKQNIMEPLAQCRESIRSRLTVEAETLADRARTFGFCGLGLLILNGSTMVLALLLFYRRRVVEPLANINRSLSELLRNQASVTVGYQQDTSEIGEIARSLEQYRAASVEVERQRWIKNQVAEIAEILHQASTFEGFAQGLLNRLTPLLEGGAAALYVLAEGDTRLRFTGGYGWAPPADQQPSFAIGESLVGQCAHEKKTLTLTDLPAGYLPIVSGVGSAPPRVLTLAPVIAHGQPLAVIEVASFSPLSPLQQALLESISGMVCLHLEILQRNLRAQRLANELQNYRDSLRGSEERARALLHGT